MGQGSVCQGLLLEAAGLHLQKTECYPLSVRDHNVIPYGHIIECSELLHQERVSEGGVQDKCQPQRH